MCISVVNQCKFANSNMLISFGNNFAIEVKNNADFLMCSAVFSLLFTTIFIALLEVIVIDPHLYHFVKYPVSAAVCTDHQSRWIISVK